MLYPSLCLVSPAMTEKFWPAIARMVPPLSEYGLKRRSVAIEITTRNGKLQVAGPRWFSLRLGNRDFPPCTLPALNTRNARLGSRGEETGLEAHRSSCGTGLDQVGRTDQPIDSRSFVLPSEMEL